MAFTEEELKLIAANLRKPEGEYGDEVVRRMNEGNLPIYHFVIEQLALKDSEKVLEIGMANGFFVPHILVQSKNIHYTGCDYSKDMVTAATTLHQNLIESEQVNIVEGHAHKLPFPDDSFDAALGINTIYFWDDPAVELKEIKRVLKPKGRLVIGMRTVETMKTYTYTQYGFNFHGQSALIVDFKSAGFKHIQCKEFVESGLNMIGEDVVRKSWIWIVS